MTQHSEISSSMIERDDDKKMDLNSLINDVKHPVEIVAKWLQEANDLGLEKPEAMNLATVGIDGKPRNRMVLMRHITETQIGFFTNLSSSKAKEITNNPNVSATLWWSEMERQVRIEGPAQPMCQDVVEAYFNSRPRKSRIAAWASKQSQPLSSMDALNKRFQEAELMFTEGDVTLPKFWGGYTISVERIEFWLGKPHRLHERIVLTKEKDGWLRSRL
ncbi:MAG TPA: pyridoxamine 5'-phosphate oxidase, partial [Candidatus Poseidoniales archaeon]